MMRKTILHGTRHVVTTLLLAAAFLSLAQPSDAAPITRKQAEQRAAKFFHKRMARKAAPVQLSLALEKPTDATSAGYYIYNKVGGGYAIVSADDTQAPIIGFSDSGHLDYFNDTVIVYRSPDYLVAPFVVVQTYQDNVISEQKQRVVDNWTIPDNALFVSFQNAIQTGRVMSVTPNQNPNTVYLIGGDQPIPVGLEDCFVINNTYLNEEEFHIEDGYPVTNKIRGSRIDYQLHFNDGEWMLLGSPFDMVLDTDALAQLDEVMTFDRFQDNTLYFKKYDKN